ncbi:hypothetical protein D9M71_651490 [compost metagenome]
MNNTVSSTLAFQRHSSRPNSNACTLNSRANNDVANTTLPGCVAIALRQNSALHARAKNALASRISISLLISGRQLRSLLHDICCRRKPGATALMRLLPC